MSATTLEVLELMKALPPHEQQQVYAELVRHAAPQGKPARRKLQRLPDGGYYNPNGIPNEDPIFKVLEEIEGERHLAVGPPSPQFD